MPWETFDKRTIPMLKTASVTIQAKGILSLNASAYTEFGKPAAVDLLFDRELNRIGLKPADPKYSPNAYPVRSVGKGNTYLVAATTFLKYYSIPFGVPTRYNVIVDGGVLVIDLNQQGRQATSNRTRGRLTAESEGDAGVPINDVPQMLEALDPVPDSGKVFKGTEALG